MNKPISAVVLGATGYVGGELLRLLADHPQFELAAAVSNSRSGETIAATYPNLAGHYGERRFSGREDWLASIEADANLALFSAAPHGASAALIAETLSTAEAKNLTVHVVDSSADFRYAEKTDYEAVYGCPHGAPDLLSQFYCAVPEHAPEITVPHIGHPGCFATTILLATVPLMRSGLAESEMFVSGTTGSTGSGAARKPARTIPNATAICTRINR